MEVGESKGLMMSFECKSIRSDGRGVNSLTDCKLHWDQGQNQRVGPVNPVNSSVRDLSHMRDFLHYFPNC